jgi:teichuronic acid biosynthesis glycosyltransferase TuaC
MIIKLQCCMLEGVKMRILAVTNVYPTAQVPSAGIYIEQQIKGLRRIGLDVEVMFVNRLQEGMKVYLGLGKRIRSEIERLQPDIVHVMYGGIMADQITRAVNDKPTVVTFHGSDLLGEHLSGFLRQLIAGYGVWSSWKAARRANGIVVVSEVLRDALPEDVDRSKVKIIPCGIDLERFKPLNRHVCRERLGWDANRFHVLFYHSNDPVKRPDLAQAAVEAAKRLGINAEMHFLHGVPNSDVPIWINASDVLLLTSLHEGSPTIVKEALACNLPVVSVDVGDVREQIQGIKGCYLALPEPGDLAAKLHLVYAGLNKAVGWGKMQGLSLEHIALRLQELYSELREPSLFFTQ